MYLVPKINLFHALKLGPQSKESANFFNKVWDQDSRFVPEVSRLIQRQGTCELALEEVRLLAHSAPSVRSPENALHLFVSGQTLTEHRGVY